MDFSKHLTSILCCEHLLHIENMHSILSQFRENRISFATSS